MAEGWNRVTKRNPCPICGKPDWCGITSDGRMAHCMRIESAKECEKGGWLHTLDEPVQVRRPHKKKKRSKSSIDFATLACRYEEQFLDIEQKANELGVSVRSLERLHVGRKNGYLSWPMRDAYDSTIGIQLQASDGRKWCEPGSHNGVFWPDGVEAFGDTDLYLPEGGSDTASLLTLDYQAIGRPSCNGGVDIILTIVKTKRRNIVIVSDRDDVKYRPNGDEYYPGQNGAMRLAKTILPFVKSVKIVTPPTYKDVRQWLQGGLTRSLFDAIISNTEYFYG